MLSERQIIKKARKLILDTGIEYLLVIDANTGKYLKYRGKIDECNFDLKEINEFVENDIWLVHNHPTNTLRFSLQDFNATFQIEKAVKKTGYTMINHILLTDNEFKTMY